MLSREAAEVADIGDSIVERNIREDIIPEVVGELAPSSCESGSQRILVGSHCVDPKLIGSHAQMIRNC